MWRKQLLSAAALLALAACRDPIAPDGETPAGLAGLLVAVPQLLCRELFPAPPPAADLVISAPTTLTVTPTTVRPGGTVQLPSWTVKNQGTAASNAFSNGFYLSTDALITAGDVYLTGNSNYALAPGASYTWGGPKVTIPATTAPGDYYIGILVDRTNTTPEGAVSISGAPVGRECNNFTSTPLTVWVQRIAFATNRDGNYEIYHMNADGTSPRNLTNHGGLDKDAAWSPDGSEIAFTSFRDGNYEIYVMNADGTSPRNLTNHGGLDEDPAWSPHPVFEQKIAFRSHRDGNSEIYVMNPDGTRQQRLTFNEPPLGCYACGGDWGPTWSPGNTTIAFMSGRDGSSDNIFIMFANGGVIDQLTNDPANKDDPAWSPDGEKIAFTRGSDIYVMLADGSDVTRLTTHAGYDYDPAWSPDGSQIAFTSDRHGNAEIYVMNATNGEITGIVPVRLTNNQAWDGRPSWAPLP